MSGEGSDGAGGVGGDNSSNNSAAESQKSTDTLSAATEALGQAVDAVTDAVTSALSAATDAMGLSDALGALGDALGIDAEDMQGLVGAALTGAITGGLPGAVASVVNSLVGGSLTAAARDVVDDLPAAMQPLANIAIDKFMGKIPGAATSINPQNALATLASGVLTNGRVPGMEDVAAVARDMKNVANLANDLMGSIEQGNFTDVVDAANDLAATLDTNYAKARDIASSVSAGIERSGGIYGTGDHDGFGNAVEQLAVSTSRLMSQR